MQRWTTNSHRAGPVGLIPAARWAAGVAVLGLAGFGIGAGADSGSRSDLDTGAGAQLYRTYCASCHGADGTGNGPVAGALRVPPANLTLLAKKYGDPLPLDRLAEFIDGRKDVVAHGPREMPVWGEEFYEEGRPGNPKLEKAKRGTILMILNYLETIQTLRAASAPQRPDAPDAA